MKFVRRAAGYSSWAVVAVMSLEANRQVSAQPPKPIGGGAVFTATEVTLDTAAPVNVQVAWLGEPGLFTCALVAKSTPAGLECCGYVPNEAARQKALYIAKQLVGDQVVDRLHIQPGMPINLGALAVPAELAPAASTRLAEALGEKVLGLRVVSPSAGRVEVTGEIESPADKLIVSKCLKGLRGCTCVTNRVNAPTSPEGAAVVTNVPAAMVQPSGPANPAQSSAAVAFMPGMPPMSATKLVSEARPKRQMTVEMYIGAKPKWDDVDKAADIAKTNPLRAKEKPVEVVKVPTPRPTNVDKPRAVEVVPPSAYRPIETIAAKDSQPTILPPVFGKSDAPTSAPMTSKPLVSEPLLPPKFGAEIVPAVVTRPEMPKPVLPQEPMPVAPAIPDGPIIPVAKANEIKPSVPAIEATPNESSPIPGRTLITDLPANELIKPGNKVDEVAAPMIEAKPLEATPPALPVLPIDKPELARPAPVLPKLESKPVEVIKVPAIVVSPPEARNGAVVEKPIRIDLIPAAPKPMAGEQPRRIDLIPDAPKPVTVEQSKRIELIPDPPKALNPPLAAPKAPELPPATPSVLDLGPAAQKPVEAIPVTKVPEAEMPAPLPTAPPIATANAPGRATVSDLATSEPIKPATMPKPAELPKPKLPPVAPEIAIPTAKQPDRLSIPVAPAPQPLKSATVASAPLIKSVESSAPPAPRMPAETMTKSEDGEANIKGVIRQPNGNSAITLDSETVRRAVEDVCRGGATEIKVSASGNRQLTIACKVPGQGDWERLYARVKSLPEIAGYSVIYSVTTIGSATGTGSAKPAAPMMGIIRTGSTENVVESEYLRKLVEELCNGKADDVIIRATAKNQITVGMKVRSAADWDRLYASIKSLPEVAGYAVIYNVTVK